MNNKIVLQSQKEMKIIIFSLFFIIFAHHANAQVTIMPLGDSITRGIESNETTSDSGYRAFLYRDLINSGYSVNFVGEEINPTTPPSPDFDRDHQGLPGLRIDKRSVGGGVYPPLRDTVTTLLTNNPAQIVLLHMGTNDITTPTGRPTVEIKDALGEVLDSIHAVDTTTIVILARIINRIAGSDGAKIDSTTKYNLRIQAFDSLSYVYVVDMEDTLNYSTDMSNTVHPNALGYEKMAAVWSAQIKFIMDNVLPVELTAFNASASNKGILLEWNTATELNNFGFDIERATDNKQTEWKKIGFIDGHGTSNISNNYSFLDTKPFGSSKFYYRLKQIDTDGKFEYSSIAEVNIIPDQIVLSQNYPNPFNPSTSIRFSIPKADFVNISIFNVLGEKVKILVNRPYEAGSYEIKFNAGDLPSGIYFYRIDTSNFSRVKKMILAK